MIDYTSGLYARWAIHDFMQESGHRTLCRSH